MKNYVALHEQEQSAPRSSTAEPVKINAHKWEREENEHYVEPEWCSVRLFQEEEFSGAIWDPCCGFGRIPEAAKAHGYSVYASDLVDRGYLGLDEVRDFLTDQDNHASESIVANPPFNIADRFALHALSLGNTQKLALIFPTARLNAAHWIKGTPLRRVWLLTPRPSMPPGHVIARGEKPGGGKMDYCWLVWERGYQGAPELRWLRRDGERPGSDLPRMDTERERPFLMSGPITLELPTPPSVNAAYGNNKNGNGKGRYLTKTYKRWLAEADGFFIVQKWRLLGKIPITGPCEISILVPAKMRGDVSNRIKAAEDYLVSRGITGDDKNNRRVSIERSEKLAPGVCVVTITPIISE